MAGVLNTIDLGVGGTSASPTHQYLAIPVDEFEPAISVLAGIRSFADGSIDKPASPTIFSWKIVFSKIYSQFADSSAGTTSLEQVLYFIATEPKFIRGNSSEWTKRHSTSWIAVEILEDKIEMSRDTNLYFPACTVQETTPVTITAP